ETIASRPRPTTLFAHASAEFLPNTRARRSGVSSFRLTCTSPLLAMCRRRRAGGVDVMPDSAVRPSLSDRLTSRRGAWVSLGLVLLVMVLLFGAFGSAKAPEGNAAAPPDSESARTSALLDEFPNADRQSVLVVTTRDDGAALSDADLAGLKDLLPVLDERTDADATGPLVSEDGKATLLVAPISVGETNT